jgi:hypothetical protein
MTIEEDERIPRFFEPTLEDLKDLPCDEETREKIRAVLCGEILPADASPAAKAWSDSCHHRPDPTGHEMMLCAADDLLGTSGTEGLEIEGDHHHMDEGIRMCPAFSYCNAGDPYTTTLLRDHVESAWLVAGWGDALDEYERENELGSYLPCEDCDELGEHECHGGKEEDEDEEDEETSESAGVDF